MYDFFTCAHIQILFLFIYFFFRINKFSEKWREGIEYHSEYTIDWN